MVRKHEERVRIFSRRGFDFTPRFPRVVQAVRRLKLDSAVFDGEGIVYDTKGMPSFELLHSKDYDREVSLIAFDLLELNGEEGDNRIEELLHVAIVHLAGKSATVEPSSRSDWSTRSPSSASPA